METHDLLINAFEDDDPNVRKAAAHAMGDLRANTAKSALVKLLRDNEPLVCEGAVNALGYFRTRAAMRTVMEALADRSDEVRMTSATCYPRMAVAAGSPGKGSDGT